MSTVDGSFLSTILRNKIRAKELLEAALGAPARMVVTRSVVRELESIPGLEDALKMAQRLKVVTASDTASFDGFGDTPPTPVPDSLLQMVRADGNAQHFMVATQDAELRAALRKVPGVPLVYFQRVVLIVEPPSDASVRWRAVAPTAEQPTGQVDGMDGGRV